MGFSPPATLPAGISAHRAIDELATLAAGKVLMPSMTLLCDDVQLQLDAAESVGRVRWGWAASALAGSRLVKGSPMPSATPAVTLRLPDATKHPPP